MAENFTKNFVDLSNGGFGSDVCTELHLNHGESGFYVRPLMVVRKESIPVERVIMPHSLPEAVKLPVFLRSGAVGFERNIRRSVYSHYSVKILFARVCLVSRDLMDIECFSGVIYQLRKLGGISRFSRGYFNAGNNVGFDTTHQMGFNPFCLTPHFAPFVVKPSVIGSSGKARRINGEVSFYRFQRGSTLFNQTFQQGSQFRIFKATGVAGKGRGFSDQSICFSIPNVSHKPSARHIGINLIDSPENHVRQWEARSAESLFRLGNTIAEVSKKRQKAFLLVHLSIIIIMPFLGAGYFHRLRNSFSTIWFGLSFNNELDSMNMLARLLSLFIVGASAKWRSVVKIYNVASVAGLGGYFPAQYILLNLRSCRNYQSFFFSSVHLIYLRKSHLQAYITIQLMVMSIGFRNILLINISLYYIDNSIIFMVLFQVGNTIRCYNFKQMNQQNLNPIQIQLSILQHKGWTLAALADELSQRVNTLEKWKAGQRNPANEKAVLEMLGRIEARKRIPKKRRYAPGSRKSTSSEERQNG